MLTEGARLIDRRPALGVVQASLNGKKKKKVKINKQKLYKSICLLLFISFVVFKVFPPCLKALGHCVTIPVSKVLFMIFRVFLLSTLGANHVIQGSLTTAACLWFLGSPCFIFLLWV